MVATGFAFEVWCIMASREWRLPRDKSDKWIGYTMDLGYIML